MCCSVNVSVCLVGCVFDSVCELFGEIIRKLVGCGCYFVVECYGGVESGWRFFTCPSVFLGDTTHRLIICISALSNFNPTSTSKGLVSLP